MDEIERVKNEMDELLDAMFDLGMKAGMREERIENEGRK